MSTGDGLPLDGAASAVVGDLANVFEAPATAGALDDEFEGDGLDSRWAAWDPNSLGPTDPTIERGALTMQAVQSGSQRIYAGIYDQDNDLNASTPDDVTVYCGLSLSGSNADDNSDYACIGVGILRDATPVAATDQVHVAVAYSGSEFQAEACYCNQASSQNGLGTRLMFQLGGLVHCALHWNRSAGRVQAYVSLDGIGWRMVRTNIAPNVGYNMAWDPRRLAIFASSSMLGTQQPVGRVHYLRVRNEPFDMSKPVPSGAG